LELTGFETCWFGNTVVRESIADEIGHTGDSAFLDGPCLLALWHVLLIKQP